MEGYALHYGKSRKILARVLPDAKYPTMWRVHWPDGEVSDMVNLTRAKDAAIVLARQRHPALAKEKLERWRWSMPRRPAQGSYSDFSSDPAPDSPPRLNRLPAAPGALSGG